MAYTNADIRFLATTRGINFMGLTKPIEVTDGMRSDVQLAMDAQPSLITTPNAAIPALFTNLVDPELVRVIVQPLRAAEIIGETKKGDWTTLSTQFPVIESTGQVSSYGDYNTNGSTGANANWVPRQSYHYQIISEYGERQLEMYGAAKINYKSEIDTAGALTMAQFQNDSYFYGIDGLDNYGLLNDPGLTAPITPTVKAAGGTGWANATANEIYNDVLKMFRAMQSQMGGNIKRDIKLKLVLSPESDTYLMKTNEFGINVYDLLKKNLPGLDIETAPQYATAAGQLVQMIIPNYQGLQTAYAAFTEKMRAHPVVTGLSNYSQKKSAGTWGSVIRRPICILQMLGV